jgi:hypothetical protein
MAGGLPLFFEEIILNIGKLGKRNKKAGVFFLKK